MVHFIWTVGMLWIGIGCLRAQKLPARTWNELQAHLRAHPESLYVLNFWSTWCRPCIAELPYLQEAAERLSDSLPVRFWLISVDFPPDGAQKAAALLRRKGITLPAFWLNETDPNSWIPSVAPEWDGALPYTHVFGAQAGRRSPFHSAEEVVDFVRQVYAAPHMDNR